VLETARAAEELLGASIFGRGNARPGGGGGESKKSNKPSKVPRMYEWGQNNWFPALFALKITKIVIFCLKVLNKIYSQDVF
jgi:hypothetical protein